MEKLLDGIRFGLAGWGQSRNDPIKERRAQQIATMLHFELGVQYLSAIDPAWVRTHLLTPKELLLAIQKNAGGASVLRKLP
ncbi:hypothetical protein D9600_15370 [Deinococcus sp. DB0503]|nr:hypothetical protein [Deinococcus sp. DB0503]